MNAIQSMRFAWRRWMDAPTRKLGWNFRLLWMAIGAGFFLQGLLLPCLCWRGNVKMTYAICFDGVLIVRLLFAYFRHEKGKGWVFYAMLALTSAFWIQGIMNLALGVE